MRFHCANGVVVLRSCAAWEGTLQKKYLRNNKKYVSTLNGIHVKTTIFLNSRKFLILIREVIMSGCGLEFVLLSIVQRRCPFNRMGLGSRSTNFFTLVNTALHGLYLFIRAFVFKRKQRFMFGRSRKTIGVMHLAWQGIIGLIGSQVRDRKAKGKRDPQAKTLHLSQLSLPNPHIVKPSLNPRRYTQSFAHWHKTQTRLHGWTCCKLIFFTNLTNGHENGWEALLLSSFAAEANLTISSFT